MSYLTGLLDCLDGFFGIACHTACPSDCLETCDDVTGNCSAGCIPGKMGDTCQEGKCYSYQVTLDIFESPIKYWPRRNIQDNLDSYGLEQFSKAVQLKFKLLMNLHDIQRKWYIWISFYCYNAKLCVSLQTALHCDGVPIAFMIVVVPIPPRCVIPLMGNAWVAVEQNWRAFHVTSVRIPWGPFTNKD